MSLDFLPMEVPSGVLPFTVRLHVRLFSRMKMISDRGIYLSRCGVHKIYYMDVLHGKAGREMTRCPVCEKEFLDYKKMMTDKGFHFEGLTKEEK